MKRAVVIALIGISTLLWSRSAVAQEADPESQEQGSQSEEQQSPPSDEVLEEGGDARVDEDDAPDPAQQTRRKRAKRPTSSQELLRRLPKLQALMPKHLDMSTQQKRTIDELFTRQIVQLKEALERNSQSRDQSKTFAELKDLQRALRDARKEGDRTQARRIRDQIRERMSEMRSRQATPIRKFLADVRAHLSEKQQRRFRQLVERVGIRTGSRADVDAILGYFRAVLNPSTGLSSQQKRTVRELMRSFLAGARGPARSTPEERLTATEIKEQIDKMLTPEQRAKVERIMNERKAPRPKRQEPEEEEQEPEEKDEAEQEQEE